MKKIASLTLSSFLLFSANSFTTMQDVKGPFVELSVWYKAHCQYPSDINEHLPALRDLAQECNSAMEIGIRGVVSTWAVMLGLAENNSSERFYIGVDLYAPPAEKHATIRSLAASNGIEYNFWQTNDMAINPDVMPKVDLLFIDSLHTYLHLTYELNTFSGRVNKYIAMHDTSAPYGDEDEPVYGHNDNVYPAEYDRAKRGLWPAVQDFLASHPEWRLKHRYFNNHGFTILEKVGN